jgi:fructokinase
MLHQIKTQFMEKNKIKNIYAIGEIVFDIMFKNGQPVAARPGGSMLNSSISLGRSGLPVNFIGTCGKDKTGDLISAFLEENNVGRTFLHHENSKSIIALAFLDKDNNASYDFYKGEDTEKCLNFHSPGEQDIILFGSFYSISSPTRDTALNSESSHLTVAHCCFMILTSGILTLKLCSEVKPFIEENIMHSQYSQGFK